MSRLHGVLVFAAIVAFSAACLKKASTAVPVETAAISLLVVGDVTADGQPVKTGQLLKGSPWIRPPSWICRFGIRNRALSFA